MNYNKRRSKKIEDFRAGMECPKCHTKLKNDQTVCPVCHKVLALKCPNCGAIGESATCEKCGFSILVKCSKCSKINPIEKENCSKCGFSLKTSLAYQECESDEFASIMIKFSGLKAIRKLLKSQELYSKFLFKLKNLLYAQLKNIDCKLITYGDIFVINLNKELSLATSSNKAIRLALKIINAFVELNTNIIEEFKTPLNLNLTILKKTGEQLQELIVFENDVKLLTIKKGVKKYLKGFQIVLDQYIWEEINKDYKTDSLYSIEENGKQLMFYEVMLDSYVLPPSKEEDGVNISAMQAQIKKESSDNNEKDLYSFKVFDINAKCHFEKITPADLKDMFANIDFTKGGKIVSIKANKYTPVGSKQVSDILTSTGLRLFTVSCSEAMNYKPWGFFETLFKEIHNLPFHNKFIDLSTIPQSIIQSNKTGFEFIYSKPQKALTPEDARFAYMEYWGNLLSSLTNTTILIEGYEYLDDTSLQTLELYFDKFRNVKPNFIFLTADDVSLHSKIKSLLRTNLYTEFSIKKSSMEACLSSLKTDATDFIQSFYFEKIKENFRGSALYFENALQYLKDTGVLIEFDNKLIIKNKKSVVLPKDLKALYKARIKHLSKNIDASLILAYSTILGPRIDFKTLNALSIKDIESNAKLLEEAKLIKICNEIIYVNDYLLLSDVVTASLKKEAEDFITKNVLAHLGKGLDDTTLFMVMGRLKTYKEEYLTLWKNSQFAIKTGDYDAYLKNCLGFLSLVEYLGENISKEEIENNKKEVYNNILMCLYSYSPAKIYFIENILLMDAISSGDDEKIVKLSNLMLQGALIAANYTDALGLLHNILSRMPQPKLIVDGAINTKFLLLSLVNIEILYNIGNFKQCVEIAKEILEVLSPSVLEKVKPASFSTNLFVSHILETFRLAALAKLFLLDENLDEFLEQIHQALNTELPEKDAILAVKDFLAGKVYSTKNIEEYSAFSKLIFLILQEFSILKDDYKRFAQNIYQAKLLASDIHQREIELFCDLLIAFAYSKIGITEKAMAIYSDVLENAEKSAMFNIVALSRYFLAKNHLSLKNSDEAALLLSNALALLLKFENQAKILFALVEKLYIDTVKSGNVVPCNIESEEMKLAPLKVALKALF